MLLNAPKMLLKSYYKKPLPAFLSSFFLAKKNTSMHGASSSMKLQKIALFYLICVYKVFAVAFWSKVHHVACNVIGFVGQVYKSIFLACDRHSHAVCEFINTSSSSKFYLLGCFANDNVIL